MDAKELLRQLDAETLDRDRVEDPDLRALVDFADWLAFPTELGRYPDDLEIIDRRTLAWPPAHRTLPLWLIRYRARDRTGLDGDDVGVGLVGSTTFCHFGHRPGERPPEDVYALHCACECVDEKLLSMTETAAADQVRAAVGAAGVALENARAVATVRFAGKSKFRRRVLDYPGAEVLVVAGARDGTAGWLVCDGPRTTWVLAADMPEESRASTVAMLHVGRVLLGFATAGIERRSFLRPPEAVDDAAFVTRYQAALAAARDLDGEEREEAFNWGPLAAHARRYAGLLMKSGREADLRSFIDEVAPEREHPLGYSELGALAFDAGLFDLARRFIENLREAYADHHRSETMAMLARIHAREGRSAEGIALLRDCIARIRADEQCNAEEVERFSAPLVAALTELES
jgi:hypothetical protein